MQYGTRFRHYLNSSEQTADLGGKKPVRECTPEEARTLASRVAGLAGPAPEMWRVEERTIDGEDGSIILRILVTLRDMFAGSLVYYHGGGWVTGSAEEYETVARKLAERTSCAVVLVEYRLAPEYRYPAGGG